MYTDIGKPFKDTNKTENALPTITIIILKQKLIIFDCLGSTLACTYLWFVVHIRDSFKFIIYLYL